MLPDECPGLLGGKPRMDFASSNSLFQNFGFKLGEYVQPINGPGESAEMLPMPEHFVGHNSDKHLCATFPNGQTA